MKIKQRKHIVVIKNLHSAFISDQKTKSVYFKLRPLPPLSYATAEYCLYIFLFLGSEGGPWHSGPPPYASVCCICQSNELKQMNRKLSKKLEGPSRGPAKNLVGAMAHPGLTLEPPL